MSKKTVSDYWNDIFNELNILDHIKVEGFFKISANVIKKHKEPRLMTKFDHSKNRPHIFKENNLAILPIDNGEYIIGPFDLYQKLDKKDVDVIEIELPDFYETIDLKNIYSESNALIVAEISGMIKALAQEDVKNTIRGKMRANKFDFTVNSNDSPQQINVNRPQIEIDAGYETSQKIIVIEAKNLEPDDFIIRQLYYPYRYWKMRVDKEIVPVFFTFKNGVYTFYVYEFQDPENYNSIQLVNKLSYRIAFNYSNSISLNSIDIKKEINRVQFPQADAFNRIIDLIMVLADGPKTTDEITNLFEFTSRQSSYYTSAARYLGLIQGVSKHQLTDLGHEIASLKLIDRNKRLVREILSHKPFYEAYKLYLKNNGIPEKEKLVSILLSETKIQSKSTLFRRASTLKGWLTWIINSGIEIV